MTDKRAREIIKELARHVGCNVGSDFNELYAYGRNMHGTVERLERCVADLDDKLERLIKHLGLEEVQPDCTPKFVQKEPKP